MLLAPNILQPLTDVEQWLLERLQHMPAIKRMQQRLKGDKQRLQKELQAYYREHGINPLSAFAPLVVQIPVFISLYYLMRSDVAAKPQGAVPVALILTYLTSQLASSLIATRAMQGGQRGLMLALPLFFVTVISRFPAGLAVHRITRPNPGARASRKRRRGHGRRR